MRKIWDLILKWVGNHWRNSSSEVTCSDFQFRKIILLSVWKKDLQRISLEARRSVKTIGGVQARSNKDLA